MQKTKKKIVKNDRVINREKNENFFLQNFFIILCRQKSSRSSLSASAINSGFAN
jgi:hypothetical protein